VRFDKDQNSVFDETGLVEQLKRDGVTRLWIGGLAMDDCVLATVLDACQAGFQAGVLMAATRPVSEDKGKEALKKMCEAGGGDRLLIAQEFPNLSI
jgi:nicotinamidase/pyrazinamidase